MPDDALEQVDPAAKPQWPRKADMGHARASVYLSMLQLFDSNSKGWFPEAMYEKRITDLDIFMALDREQYQSVIPQHIISLRTNGYGLASTPKATVDACECVMKLFGDRFGFILTPETKRTLRELDNIARGNGADISIIQDTYGMFVERIRSKFDLEKDTQSAAIVSAYDQWIANRIGNRLSKNGDKLNSTSNHEYVLAVNRALASSRALRSSIRISGDQNQEKNPNGEIRETPFTDLFEYQTLSNELQIQIGRVRIIEDTSKFLENSVKHEDFYKKARWFYRLAPWRLQEMLHALAVASALNHQDEMREFGGRSLRSMERVMKVMFGRRPVPLDHPNFLFNTVIFVGSIAPVHNIEIRNRYMPIHHEILKSFQAEREREREKRAPEIFPDFELGEE